MLNKRTASESVNENVWILYILNQSEKKKTLHVK